MRSAFSGLKSDSIRVAVFSSSENKVRDNTTDLIRVRVHIPLLGRNKEYVTGTVTRLVIVSMK